MALDESSFLPSMGVLGSRDGERETLSVLLDIFFSVLTTALGMGQVLNNC